MRFLDNLISYWIIKNFIAIFRRMTFFLAKITIINAVKSTFKQKLMFEHIKLFLYIYFYYEEIL